MKLESLVIANQNVAALKVVGSNDLVLHIRPRTHFLRTAHQDSHFVFTIYYIERLFTYHLSLINYSRFVQIIWLLNSRLIREYLFQPTRLSPFL